MCGLQWYPYTIWPIKRKVIKKIHPIRILFGLKIWSNTNANDKSLEYIFEYQINWSPLFWYLVAGQGIGIGTLRAIGLNINVSDIFCPLKIYVCTVLNIMISLPQLVFISFFRTFVCVVISEDCNFHQAHRWVEHSMGYVHNAYIRGGHNRSYQGRLFICLMLLFMFNPLLSRDDLREPPPKI